MTFPAGTGKGGDNVAPRSFARLSDAALEALCAVYSAAETSGKWPKVWDMVLIVLLTKADGGLRPIGLFMAPIRIWMRSRYDMIRQWEAKHYEKCLYGGPSMGAQRAAWLASFKTERAAEQQEHCALALLDLAKAFELVPHDILLQNAHH